MELRLALSSLLLCMLLDSVHPEDWIHYTVLDGDGNYHLYWNPPEDKRGHNEITFKVEVKTRGYVGFGLSPNGGMAGSDILTAWIKDEKIYFQDRYGVGNSMPMKDDKQDWNLISSYENDTWTVFQFSRKLDTCDDEDMVIDESTMRVIYAYSEEDPDSENPVYHHDNRGSRSIMLLQSKIKRNMNLDFSSLLYWDIKSPDINISSHKSLYWCKIFKTPPVSEKHHIVYVKPLIQEGHEQFVHHMLLYECVGGDPDEYEEYVEYKGHVCHQRNMPNVMKRCEGVSIAWAVGGEDLVFPEHVGLPLEPEPGTYFMLETHYDNQHLRSEIIDHSGLRMYYTPDLRKFDAGCLMLGSSISPRLFIPPGQEKYVVVGHSNPDCLAPEFPENGVKALGILMHSHLLGRRIKARHFRGNKELVPLAEEKNYDFNYQEYRYYTEEVDILKNDQITVECTYDSTGRTNVTFGGESTTDEMCLAFVLYYPRISRYASLSVPTFVEINTALKRNLSNVLDIYSLLDYDWSSVNISDVEDAMKNSLQNTHCYFGNGQKNKVKSQISYPSDLEPFETESTCNDFEQTSSGCAPFSQTQNLFIFFCVVCLILNLQK